MAVLAIAMLSLALDPQPACGGRAWLRRSCAWQVCQLRLITACLCARSRR